MNTIALKILANSLVICLSQNLLADESAPQGLESWSMKTIYQPSRSLLDREKRGLVNIYDGFTDTQVNQVLDDKFGRIDHMMFTRVKTTGTDGRVLKDPVSGEEMVEDDGCDE
jgi:hypothetical protein